MRKYDNTKGKKLLVPDGERQTGNDKDSLRSNERSTVERIDILPKNTAFVLKNFLTNDECQDFIHQAETLGLSDCGYSKRIRITDRVAAEGEDVANVLFHRLLPYLDGSINLSDKSSTKQYPVGIPDTTRPYDWRPVGLNPVFRICKYEPNGFFLPHYDGGLIQTKFRQSLKTFMIYLNDDFDGGETRFFNSNQRHYVPPSDLDNNVIYSYQPQTGDVLVFNSQITHDGGTIMKGQKYIMRSEVMYHAPVEEQASELKKKMKSRNQTIRPDHDPNIDFTWP